MTERYDAVVVGAGHNGLVASAYLARAGCRVVVLERRDVVGGILATTELEPGVKTPTLVHDVGRLRASVFRDLRLAAHGLRLIRPDVQVFAPDGEGGAVTLWRDVGRTADGLRAHSTRDATEYPRFDRRLRSMASFMAYLHAMTPPDLESPTLADALAGMKLFRAYTRLSTRAKRELLRVLAMPVADLVGETFDRDALRAALSVRALEFTAMTPRTAGTSAVLMSDSAGSGGGAAGQIAFAAGGPSALADALASAARSFGGEVRTGADVASILTSNGRATGVALTNGEEITARVVLSAADPKRTLLTLLDPEELGPMLVWRASNIRMPGGTAKVNLSLSGLPRFTAADGEGDERLRGRIVIARGMDHLERAADAAKYRRMSDEPYMEATIPSLSDGRLARDGRHVMSVIVQSTPYRLHESDWSTEREGLGDLVVKTLEEYAPGISNLITTREVLTPVDLEHDFALTGGHVLHGEPGLDQFFAWRPLLGFARYRMPLDGLYLCGSGAHPGGGVTGAPGANAAREVLVDLKRH